MKISVVVYDNFATSRIKSKILCYLSKYENVEIDKDTLWVDDMYIAFQERLIILNSLNKIEDDKIQRYLYDFLINEEVTIHKGKCTEYSKRYGESKKLMVTYS